MELMELGSKKGIAGIYNLKTMKDVMELKPKYNINSSGNETILAVTAILSDGTHKEIERGYIDTESGEKHTAPVIGEQIKGLSINALIFHHEKYSQNGGEDLKEYLTTIVQTEKVIKEIMEAWDKIMAAAKATYPDATEDERYHIVKDIMNKSIKIK